MLVEAAEGEILDVGQGERQVLVKLGCTPVQKENNCP